MCKTLKNILLTVVVFIVTQSSYAQYYSWGADRSSLKWSTIDGERVSVIYPDSAELVARRMLHYINAIQPDIAHGFKYPALEIPFVVHPENFSSNGMVMWAPLRVEFLSTPAVDSYSMPWVKQLVAHEYRHAVQYNNLDRSTLRWAQYILGQQGAAASLLFPPLYALEGDAVLSETLMSSYGRGLQPSFTMGYRAYGDELLDKKDYLKWRCGSFLSHVPNHYNMGYQMITYANNNYGEDILDKCFGYIARNPQFVLPYTFALRKFYDTSSKELLFDAFGALVEQWDALSDVENSAKIISESQERNYTTYSTPIELENGDIVALKTDYRDTYRFVVIDPESGEERVVAHIGYPSTRASYASGRLWWTEYRRSPLFAEDVNSQLCYMDVGQGRPKSLKGFKNALYPTPIDGSKGHIAYVEYNPSGQYSVVEMIDEEIVKRTDVEYPTEIHSMAWDNLTERLYIIVTGDEGMWIEQEGENGFEPLTKPAFVTISSLSAANGVLYFGSIASGRDEVHSLDIATGVESQLSESTYGSFDPYMGRDQLFMTTYDKLGYHLSGQPNNLKIRDVEYSKLPKNIFNQPLPKSDVINLDTVKYNPVVADQSKEEVQPKRYRKGLNLINIHSWAPIRFNPLSILDEQTLDVGLGATLVSQNLLSTCDGYLSYGWDHYEGSVVNVGLNYNGLGVDLGLSATYGGDQRLYLVEGSGFNLKRYASINFMASLPLYFNTGYHNHSLTTYAGWSYSNGVVPYGLDLDYSYNPSLQQFYTKFTCDGFVEGLHKLSLGFSYTNYVQSAYQDLLTPWGYTISANYAANPLNSDFSQLLSLYTKIYTPGLAKNNSFTISAAFQDSFSGFQHAGYSPLSYMSSQLIPHGFSYIDITNNNFVAVSAEYKFPLCYPEWGISKVLYVKRLSLGAGVDYASFDRYISSRSTIYSYGGSIIADINAISFSPASTLRLEFSIYKPLDRDLYFQFGMSLPF